MGGAYTILGRTVQPHQLALGTLGAVLLLVVPNPFKSKPAAKPLFTASSKEEEDFIKAYLDKHVTNAEKH